jgi:hypothetical protein
LQAADRELNAAAFQLEAAHVPYKIDLVQEHFIDSIKADAVRLGSALVSKVSSPGIIS